MNVRVMGMAGAVALVVLAGWLVVRFSSENPAPPASAKADKDPTGKSKRVRNESKQSKKPLPETVRRSSWFSKEGKAPEVSDEQIASFLENNRRSATALLAASRIKNNVEFLREAAKSAPGDKLVQLELAIRGVTPEEKREALDRYLKLEPNNSYGNYLAALQDFQQGKREDAIANLDAAEKHSEYQVPSAEVRQACEDAYLSVGFTPVEAKAAALFLQPTIYTAPMNQLTNFLVNANPLGVQKPDAESSGRLLQAALGFSRKISGGQSSLISEMMALAIETRVLQAFPADQPLPGSNKTPAQRLAELATERAEITSLGKEAAAIQADMTESEFLKYLKRVESEGEVSALKNLRDK